ncbi:MAG: two-component regulator propeller domain-containing protein [Bacteroidota bacterium]|nr:two-component regulator propeller domain-containing protein [Bacteroidota bacterium]
MLIRNHTISQLMILKGGTCNNVLKNNLLLLLMFALANITSLHAEIFSFRHYKVENGLSFNTVRSILQDRQGFMWFGTEDGLNRFDGLNFKEFRDIRVGKNLFGSNYMCTLHEDARGVIWVGTDVGILCYDRVTESFFRFRQATSQGVVINSTVNNIAEDTNGTVWISTYGQGIFGYNIRTGKLEQFRFLSDNTGKRVCDMINYVYADRENRIWIAPKSPNNPLLLLNRQSKKIAAVPLKIATSSVRPFTIYNIFEDSKRNLWLGTWDQGLCKLNRSNYNTDFYLLPQKPGGILHVHEINEYRPGELLIGSDDGLSYFNTQSLAHQLYVPKETEPSSLSDKFVYPIYKDREGGIWIGTYYGGVNYLSPNSGLFERFTHSSYVNSVNGNVIGAFTEDKKGNVWIASDDGGISCQSKTNGKFSYYVPNGGKNGLSCFNVHAFCWDEDKLWIGTYAGGLNVLDTRTGTFKHYNSEDNNLNTLDGGSIYAIFKDRDGRMWVASMSGLNVYNRKNDSFVRFKNLNSTTVSIKQDQKGFIWFATSGRGLFRYDPSSGKWVNYVNRLNDVRSLPNNQINCMQIDHLSRFWIGTSSGLCRYDYKRNVFMEIPLSIPSKTICSIVEVDNVLWLTTSKGLVRYDLKDGKIRLFTKADGLLSDQFIFNSGYRSATGKIYFGTANGFISFDPKRIVPSRFIPSVVITGLEIFNKEVAVESKGILTRSASLTDKIDLSYKDNVFSIGFVALSYNTPEKNRYAYKLEGFDKEWNYVTNQYKATYTNLPAGTYEFKVKASNSDGVWNENGASVKIIIHPPLWLTTGFKLLYVVLVMIAIFYILKLQQRRTEKNHAEKMKELKQEKEKELYDAKIQFFTMVAHEIRTPVSLIIGPLEKIMESKTELPDYILKALNIIDRNSQRLLLLVNQLLDFRKVEQGVLTVSKAPTNIYELVNAVYERFKPLVEQNGNTFDFHCDNKLFMADVDKEAVTKIISNLLSNAMKFAESRIAISVSYELEDCFVIRVEDDGRGISDEEKEKIFLPFYQVVSHNKPGTGLGLSLVKNLTEAHGGTVAIEDVSPHGVAFEVRLPLSCEQADSVQVPFDQSRTVGIDGVILPVSDTSIAPESKAIEKPVLLVVEDNAEMRNFLKDSFEEEYYVVTSANGKEGLDALKKTEVQLIVSDLMMPVMDGLEFCAALRENVIWSHIPIVLLTAKTDLLSKIEGMNCGADAYVEKPFSMAFLKAQIRNLIENRKVLRRRFSEMPMVSLSSIASNKADEEFLTKMNAIIEQNISNFDFTIEALADQLHVSRSGLFAKIKVLADVTPNELIQIVRLKKGAELLAENKYRINEIAYMVGFNNPSYFTKCFQKQFGMRPGDFIRRNEV